MKSTRNGLLTGVIVVLILLYSQADADICIKQTVKDETLGKLDTLTLWFSEQRAYQIGVGGKATLILVDKEKLYLIDHNTKEATEVSLAATTNHMDAITLGAIEMAEKEQGRKLTEEEKAMFVEYSKSPEMAALLGSVKMVVTPGTETKKIRDWNVKRYTAKITLSGSENVSSIEIWASEDIVLDFDAYRKLSYASMASMPGFTEMLEEAKKIKGFPVHGVVHMTIKGQTYTTIAELISVTERIAPDKTYEIPEGYTIKTPTLVLEEKK